MRDKNSLYLFYFYIILFVAGVGTFIIAPQVISALLVLGGGYGIYNDRVHNRPEREALESKVRECLRLTANENIHKAKTSHHSEPVSFFDKLRGSFGEQWVLDLNEHQINWMRDVYDEMISSYTGEQLELSKRRAVLEDFGASEQRQLSAYFRGKEEQDQIDSGNYNVKDGVNWDRLITENNKGRGDPQNS